MHLFHLKTEHGTDEQGSVRTWHVAADTLFDAMILVPDGNIIKAVSVDLGAASGPERLVNCAEPQSDEPAVLGRHGVA